MFQKKGATVKALEMLLLRPTAVGKDSKVQPIRKEVASIGIDGAILKTEATVKESQGVALKKWAIIKELEGDGVKKGSIAKKQRKTMFIDSTSMCKLLQVLQQPIRAS